MNKDSRLSGLHRLSIAGRIDALAARGWLTPEDAARLSEAVLLEREVADGMAENVIGVFGLPFAVAPNFTINGRDYLVPMAIEEPSVVAGLSAAARLARRGGGFAVRPPESLLIGQIHIVDIADPPAARRALEAAADELVARANALHPSLVARGGGARAIETQHRALAGGDAVVLHLIVDTCDAMGANIVDTMCEGIAPEVAHIASGRAALAILSNLADRALVTAAAALPVDVLAVAGFPGERVRDAIVQATDLANADPYRAATHNKGVMNGIDAVAVATGNDWRAIEAGAHAWAARDGAYRALTRWTVDTDGRLAGELTMPMKVGIVGGSLKANPGSRLALGLLGVASAGELAAVMGAVGLAQNLAALRALVTHGIQKGHMRLHARSVAVSAGAPPEQVDRVAAGLPESGEIEAARAREPLGEPGAEGDGSLARRDSAVGVAAAVQGRAAGKVILLGEHAAVYGRHVLALPIPDAVAVSLAETEGSPRVHVAGSNGPASAAVLQHVRELTAFLAARLGCGERRFDVRLSSRIPPAMGLGASAALAVALVRAFDTVLSLGLDDAAVNAHAFACEELAHGTPSGIDNTVATFGRPILFRKATGVVETLALPESPPLVIAAGRTRGITRDQVAAVRARFERQRDRYNALFDEIDALAVAGAAALGRGDLLALGELMNVCHGLLNALQVSTPELESMVHVARTNGALGAKLTGAGGGGSIVALAPGRTGEVARALEASGATVVAVMGR
ncbi:MAG TPA: hydroxymethylglutaryl-CoA reductase, degradative [Woeseiaceae bacterium]